MRVEVFSKISAMFRPRRYRGLGPGLLGRLQLGGQLDQAAELLRGEVQLLEEVAAGEVVSPWGLLGRGRVLT